MNDEKATKEWFCINCLMDDDVCDCPAYYGAARDPITLWRKSIDHCDPATGAAI